MKKITKKFVGDFLTETSGELNWCVFSFDKQTGIREFAYGAHNFMDAFAQITIQLSKGLDVILTNKEGWDFSFEYEKTSPHRRVTYELMKPFQIYIDEFTHVIMTSKTRFL